MEHLNSLSLVKRYDNSYFYIVELGFFSGLYKYMIGNWNGNNIDKPFIIYSHTKRSSLEEIDKDFFDNNLLAQFRLDRYVNEKNNLYIGGIDRRNSIPIREYKEGTIIAKKYKVFIRDNNYIIIDVIKEGEIKSYTIYEFINKKTIMDFESTTIYTEKDLLNMEEESDYVINSLLSKERVAEKIITNKGYVGSVEKINGEYRKTFNEMNISKILN